MTDVNKAIQPVQSVVTVPLNEGTEFKANNYILFRLSSAQLNMWLTNDSYLSFDFVYKRSASTLNVDAQANNNMNPSYIRNAANIFRSIEILYGSKTIYNQPYNIEQNTINTLTYGESYLTGNYATYTTRKTIANGQDYLKLDNGKATNGSDTIAAMATEATIKNVMIPINQLFPIFQDITSNGFPMRSLKSQLEFRLYIAEPYRYIVDWDHTIKDFSHQCRIAATDAEKVKYLTTSIEKRFSSTDVKLTNVRMYCANYIADQSTAALVDEKCGVGEGMKFKYSMVVSALRQLDKLGGSNNLPFSVTTNNTKSLMLYCHRTGLSPSLMYRPLISSLYVKFGQNQLPFQPIAGNSFDTPFEYKFTSDDVLNNIDTYFTETNGDYNGSYRFIPSDASNTDNRDALRDSVPTSSFVLMGANYVNDPSALGSQSSAWNSQYQASFNSDSTETTITDRPLTFVLGVRTEMGMIIKNNEIDTVNL